MAPIILITLFLSIVIINVFFGIKAIEKRKYYFALYNAERTKSYFAKARNELMVLAMNNKIDTQSEYFVTLYSLNTLMMRNPNAYSILSKEFTKSLLTIKSKGAYGLTEGERKISYLTAQALGHIVINYSGFMRLLYKVIHATVDKNMDQANFIGFLIHIGHIENKIRAEQEIKTTREELFRLSETSGYIAC